MSPRITQMPDARCQAKVFDKNSSGAMGKYNLSDNAHVILSLQHTYMSPHQCNYMHANFWDSNQHLIKCRVEPKKRRPRATMIPLQMTVNIDITCYQTCMRLYNFSMSKFTINVLSLGICWIEWFIQCSWHLRVNHYGMDPGVSYPTSCWSPLCISWVSICCISY